MHTLSSELKERFAQNGNLRLSESRGQACLNYAEREQILAKPKSEK